MNATVNPETCIGCGLCPSVCPAVFAMAGAVAEVICSPVPPAEEAACREAAESCPAGAITITE